LLVSFTTLHELGGVRDGANPSQKNTYWKWPRYKRSETLKLKCLTKCILLTEQHNYKLSEELKL